MKQFKEEAQLQGGDKESLRIWKKICETSRREFDKIQRLGVDLDERGESFYNSMLHDVIAELEKQKLAEQK